MERNEDAARELVWAKFSRYPWWPAFLTGAQSADAVEVQFFGTFELSFVRPECVRPLGAAPPLEPKDLRSKRLQLAIESAFSVQEGVSTIEQEREKVASGGAGPNPARLGRALARIAEQLQHDAGGEPGAGLSRLDSSEALSRSDAGASPCPSCQKPESFEALQRRIEAAHARVAAFGEGFAAELEAFCAAVRESLAERHLKELLGSHVGRLLVQLKAQLQASALGKELRRRALYDLTALLTSMKKEVVAYFFAQAEGAEPAPQGLADKVLELSAAKPEEKPAALFGASPKRTSSHRSAQNPAAAAEPEQYKEKFKIAGDVKNRVLKKFSKFLLQYSDHKLGKAEAEKLARLVHEQICAQTSTLNEYKRSVVSFVHKRAELCDFLRFKCSAEHVGSLEGVWDDLLLLLFS